MVYLDPKKLGKKKKQPDYIKNGQVNSFNIDNDKMKEPVGIEDDGPDDASDPIKPTAITLVRPPR